MHIATIWKNAWIGAFKASFSGLRLPSECLVCHVWPVADSVCNACRECFQTQPVRCLHCALPLTVIPRAQPQVLLCAQCLIQPHRLGLEVCAAALDYAYPWTQLLFAYKFQSQIGLARVLARLMAEAPSIVTLLQDCDYLIPVPLSLERLATRGFNQALQLAWLLRRYSAKRSQVLAHALCRLRNTPAQAQLAYKQRSHNVRGAFALQSHYAPDLCGKRLLLLDDVITTGATLAACAQALHWARPATLGAIVCMRTPQH